MCPYREALSLATHFLLPAQGYSCALEGKSGLLWEREDYKPSFSSNPSVFSKFH
jgi:hypothetical protein